MARLTVSVLIQSQNLPRFWIFMYRVSPFTYFVEAILGVAVAGAPAQCSSTEIVRVISPTGTCADFLGAYQSFAGGTILNPQSTGECEFCSIATTDVFLSQVGISFSNRWRDSGIIWVFILFNIFAAVFLYWLARVVSSSFSAPVGRR
jgi:ABC-type multidrug transport system permease subunit